MVIYKAVLLMFCLLGFPVLIKAQGNSGISCSFCMDTVVTRYNETFSNKLKFANQTTKPVTLKLNKCTDGALLKLPDTVTVKPGETCVYPVKYLASPAVILKAYQAISACYTNAANQIVLQTSFIVKIDQPYKLTMSMVEPMVYLNSATGFARFKVKVVNGHIASNVQLRLRAYPEGLQILNPLQQMALNPEDEQVLEYEVKLLKQPNAYLNDFRITIECLDAKGQNLATTVLPVLSLGSNKRQDVPDASFGRVNNTVALSYTYLNKSSAYYAVSANGNITEGLNNRIHYNANVYYNTSNNGLDVFDTWIGYDSKRFSVRAGNIADNLDYPLYGRGMAVAFNADKHNTISVYGLQNDYFLLTGNNAQPSAKIMGASYSFNKVNSGRVNLLYSYDPANRMVTRFTNGFFRISLPKQQYLELKGGLSEENQDYREVSKTGYALGAIYGYRSKSLDINLNNYFSSPYYTGLQRGTQQLDEHINLHLSKSLNVFGHYGYLNNSPKFLVDTITNAALFNNNTAIYEAGFNISLKALSITVHPYLLHQQTNQSFDLQNLNIASDSYSVSKRVGLDLTYSFRKSQINILSDYGITKSNAGGGFYNDYSGLKIMANYYSGFWGLSSIIQTAPYYLSEQYVTLNTGRAYHNYAIGPSLRYSAAGNRLNISVNDYLNLTSYGTKRSNSLTAQVNYNCNKGWIVSGQVFYNNFALVNTTATQVKLGIAKQFLKESQPGFHKLELRFFEDFNHNDSWDNNENAVEGMIVNLLQENQGSDLPLSTITGKRGIISYNNLKNGTYTIQILRSNGLYLSFPLTISMNKDQKISVPLTKSGQLRGQLRAVKQEYLNSNPNLEGIQIVALDNQGHRFKTLTDEAGSFEFNLPVNQYTLDFDLDPQKFSVKKFDNRMMIGLINKFLEIEIVDESHKVIVKQF